MGFTCGRSVIKIVAMMAAINIFALIAPATYISYFYPLSVQPHLHKRWHAEPPPVLQHSCLVVDKVNERTYMIGYDSRNTLTFNFMDSTEACGVEKHEKHRGNKSEGNSSPWLDNDGFDWKHAQWISLPYPGGVHQGRRFDTEHCFLTSDNMFMVPTYEKDGQGGFSVWDHEKRTWTHSKIDKRCSCHEEDIENGSKFKVKKEHKRLRFEHPNLFAVVYQSYRKYAPRRGQTSTNVEEAIDTVVIQWKDGHGRDHLTGVQLVNHQVYSCHDIKIGRNILPSELSLAASPNNPYHYTYDNTPRKFKHQGDHASRCENTTLFLLGPHGSGWLDITIADRPSKTPVDIMYHHDRDNEGIEVKAGFFHNLPALEADRPRAVYYDSQLWIFGKNSQGVSVWSIDTSSEHESNSRHGYEITHKSQGGYSPGDLTCASCGDGILVYGGCDSPNDCSTNLRSGEVGETGGNAPVVIFKPDNYDDNGGGKGEGEGE
ncbi:hypothetical protein BGZ51_006767, partial [Haplosporangium sp. Z 767]